VHNKSYVLEKKIKASEYSDGGAWLNIEDEGVKYNE
jgi:hypothetical protein